MLSATDEVTIPRAATGMCAESDQTSKEQAKLFPQSIEALKLCEPRGLGHYRSWILDPKDVGSL